MWITPHVLAPFGVGSADEEYVEEVETACRIGAIQAWQHAHQPKRVHWGVDQSGIWVGASTPSQADQAVSVTLARFHARNQVWKTILLDRSGINRVTPWIEEWVTVDRRTYGYQIGRLDDWMDKFRSHIRHIEHQPYGSMRRPRLWVYVAHQDEAAQDIHSLSALLRFAPDLWARYRYAIALVVVAMAADTVAHLAPYGAGLLVGANRDRLAAEALPSWMRVPLAPTHVPANGLWCWSEQQVITPIQYGRQQVPRTLPVFAHIADETIGRYPYETWLKTLPSTPTRRSQGW